MYAFASTHTAPRAPADATAKDDKAGDVKAPSSKLDVVMLLKHRLKTRNPHKVRQRAAIALGRLSVGDDTFAHTSIIIQSLLDTSEVCVLL